MRNYFGRGGLLAQHLGNFEPRSGQEEMASAVQELLATAMESPLGEHDQADCLVVEAETGLGKTLAYLIPAVLSGRKVVISTNTRNLQDQILQREIPFIRQHLAPKLEAICVKGRQNYLCRYRWQQLHSEQQTSLLPDERSASISQWLEETTYGDRAELSWLSSGSSLWQKICCLSHFCLGNDCPENSRCFLNRLRRDAAASQLLIVNHHLLFSDLAVRKTGYGEVLPRYEAVIFDEAHHLENVATTFFGHSFSRLQINDLLGDIERSTASLSPGPKKQLMARTSSLAASTEALASLFPQERGRFPLQQLASLHPAIRTAADSVLHTLENLEERLSDLGDSSEPWEQYANRCRDLAERLKLICAELESAEAAEDPHYTYWWERSDRNLSLFATPVDVSQELQTTLYASVAACVFTSATLTTGGSFDYFAKRLGLPEETITLSFASPFDYRNQTLLYVPGQNFPEPASPLYPQAAHGQIETLISHARGRALVLFTSFKAMETAYATLKDRLDYPVLIQGQAPRHTLLSQFSRETDSILFAVSSFWEGVDIPGESLSLLIIDKLPFEVPSDPVLMARINQIKARGGNPFFSFQVPRAIISLRQGVGRLMRSSTDRGVMAILDIRLFTKGYGRRFLKSLPPSPLTRDPQQVAHFFTDTHGNH
ncbi:ATP-dependent DNA helicase [Desulfogranum mediterraneum]|uniref:ATP-dependent DNA helicase n=1 Tax=Desulfogranum mediterraneum TaxID=160661 RepID=UPI000422A70E|nr:ATP-dependent DNA helicase [Desulfogranum mediterraneum]